jgi:hypothetical protein
MAEQLNITRRYLNQFRNRNVIKDTTATTTTITNINIPPDMMEMVENAANLLYNLTSSVSYISQSLTTQSIQIEDLSSTANALNSSKIFVNKEIPSGSIDGINTRYTLEHKPTLGSDHLYLNGLLIEDGVSTDYSISGSTIIFSEPLISGMKLHCTYYYADSTPVKVLVDKEIPFGSIDGINYVYVLKNTPVEGSEHVYLNGLLQESGGNDYTIFENTITFITPPETGLKIRVSYYHLM